MHVVCQYVRWRRRISVCLESERESRWREPIRPHVQEHGDHVHNRDHCDGCCRCAQVRDEDGDGHCVSTCLSGVTATSTRVGACVPSCTLETVYLRLLGERSRQPSDPRRTNGRSGSTGRTVGQRWGVNGAPCAIDTDARRACRSPVSTRPECLPNARASRSEEARAYVGRDYAALD